MSTDCRRPTSSPSGCRASLFLDRRCLLALGSGAWLLPAGLSSAPADALPLIELPGHVEHWTSSCRILQEHGIGLPIIAGLLCWSASGRSVRALQTGIARAGWAAIAIAAGQRPSLGDKPRRQCRSHPRLSGRSSGARPSHSSWRPLDRRSLARPGTSRRLRGRWRWRLLLGAIGDRDGPHPHRAPTAGDRNGGRCPGAGPTCIIVV